MMFSSTRCVCLSRAGKRWWAKQTSTWLTAWCQSKSPRTSALCATLPMTWALKSRLSASKPVSLSFTCTGKSVRVDHAVGLMKTALTFAFKQWKSGSYCFSSFSHLIPAFIPTWQHCYGKGHSAHAIFGFWCSEGAAVSEEVRRVFCAPSQAASVMEFQT